MKIVEKHKFTGRRFMAHILTIQCQPLKGHLGFGDLQVFVICILMAKNNCKNFRNEKMVVRMQNSQYICLRNILNHNRYSHS